MVIYQAKGFQSNLVYPYDKIEPFEYIAHFTPLAFPKGTDINEYKRSKAPYCISGKIRAEKTGTYRRNNDSLLYRDLIFLDYDELEASVDFPRIVSERLSEYSYIIYPTIKHTPEKPRYRLVVKPSGNMTEATYKQVVKEIADIIGLPFDIASLTWSQLQGLPVTTGNLEDYQKTVNRGIDYPIPRTNQERTVTTSYTPPPIGQLSITMKVINTLFNGFGTEGGRNVAMTKFVGLLLNKYVNCDIEIAYNLALIANENTEHPLTINELDATFKSILQAEMRKRGKTL
ncbi:primase alpha helix C-terminal domain-containing protein [Streptococcus parasuis]